MGQVASVSKLANKSCLYSLATQSTTTPSVQCLDFVKELATIYQSFSSTTCPRVCELVKNKERTINLAEALSEALTTLDWFQIAVVILILMIGAGLMVLIIATCVTRCEHKASCMGREARRQQAAAAARKPTAQVTRIPPLEHC